MASFLCIIGKSFNVSCNQNHFNIPVGSTHWQSIAASEKEEILLKAQICGIQLEYDVESKICNHHKAELTYPSSKGKRILASCVNPFQTHKGGVQAGVLKATYYFKHLRGNKFNILPGQHVCNNCINRCKREAENEAQANEDDEWQNNEAPKFTKINDVCRILGLSDFVVTKLNRKRITKKAELKLEEIVNAIITEFKNQNVEFSSIYEEQPFQKAKDHDSIFSEIKQKFGNSSYKDKIQLLTIIPPSSNFWTLERASKYFECSRYAVGKSRDVRDKLGFLAIPPPCKPKVFLHPDVVQAVLRFYKREDNVWQSPNVRDTKRIKLETGTQVQRKVFLLHSLKELYTLFKSENSSLNIKLGFSSFAKLRPQECELYGTMSLQNVCVCMIHGNIELMLSGIGEGKELRQKLMKSLVCDINKTECMIGICNTCSNNCKQLKQMDFCAIMEEVLGEEHFQDGIKFSSWTYDKANSASKRISLVESKIPVADYIKALYTKFLDFVPHQTITKIQSQAFQEQKKEHAESTALVIGDFSENYTCVYQNEVQSAYFSKTQVTVHPFVAYVKFEGKEQVISSAVISDCLKHETITFYSFQTSFLKYLCTKFPHLKHIEYWSDGCAAQYKNYKNFINLWFHKEDFGLTANWNYFATSHGKTGSDGVGATVKYRTKNESLRRISSNFIDSAEKVYNFCRSQNWEIHPLYVSVNDIDELTAKMMLRNRFGLIKTLPQTQKCHRVEINETTIKLFRTSSSHLPFFEVSPPVGSQSCVIENQAQSIIPSNDFVATQFPYIVLVDDLDLTVDSFIALNRNGVLFIAKIAGLPNTEVGTVAVQCLKVAGCEMTFTLADMNADVINVKTSDVVSLLHPIAAGTTKRAAGQLKLKSPEIAAVNEELQNRIKRRTLLK